ncbi:hypothetical protein HanPI659440_Chr08g0289651 [Helianthus annuus]|nr:hypothetical protein HanPI659440_Chr08g0289651 [Helianthus annuus]
MTRILVTGEWSLFDFVDPLRHVALKAADCVIGEQEPDVLKVHLEQFLLPAVPANPAVYISQPPPSGGSSVTVPEKKPTRIKVTGRKYMAVGVATSSTGGTAPARGAIPATVELTSPTHVSKKCKTSTVPTLTAFEAMQAAYAPPLGTTGGVQVESVTPIPLTSVGVMSSAASETNLSGLIFKASATAVASCVMPPPMLTTAVTLTTSPVSTPLPSSVTPSSLFDSPLSIFSATEKEIPAVSTAHEATSAGGTADSDAGGSSSGIADDGVRLGDDLYLPTINWDPNIQDKRY